MWVSNKAGFEGHTISRRANVEVNQYFRGDSELHHKRESRNHVSGRKTWCNIGAAEGYYACGFAAAMPSVQVTAFEAVVRGRYLLQGTVDRNGLSGRVIVKGLCDADELDICLSAARGSVLVVCDAEGYEYELLDPERVMRLGRAAILVEVHDFAMDGLSELLKQRFSKSHIIEEVHPRPRRREDFPIKVARMRWMPERYFNSFTSDSRPQDNFWLWMLPSQMHSLPTG